MQQLNDIWQGFKQTDLIGLNMELQDGDRRQFSAVHIKLNKGELEVQSAEGPVEALDELSLVKEKIPVVLGLSGKGMVHRRLKLKADEPVQHKMGAILPNANIADFYLQQIDEEESHGWYSVMRREAVDECVSQCMDAGVVVSKVFLGQFSFEVISELVLSQNNGRLTIGHTHLEFEQGKIIQLSKAESNGQASKTYDIDGHALNGGQLSAFALAVEGQYPRPNVATINHELSAQAYADFNDQQKFKKIGVAALGGFLVILLANFFAFSHYNDKATSLEITLRSHQQLLQQLDLLRKDLKQQEDFYRSGGFEHRAQTAFYADRLASELPKAIVLEQLAIHPVIGKFEEGEPAEFDHEHILIKGVTNKGSELNKWIRIIQEYDWVADLVVKRFDNEKQRRGGAFELEIKIGNNE